MGKKATDLEQKIEKMRAQMKNAYTHHKQSLNNDDIYHLSTKLDSLITSYMKSYYS